MRGMSKKCRNFCPNNLILGAVKNTDTPGYGYAKFGESRGYGNGYAHFLPDTLRLIPDMGCNF